MTNLFISYSRKDVEIARKLTQAFDEQGFDSWIDWEDIPPTVEWWRRIENGIEEADTFLFLISPDSTKSIICRREILHAVQNGKRLIPVVVRDIKADESPAELQSINWIFLRQSDDFAEGFDKLITAVKTDYEWVQTHRQLQVKALEWERNNHGNGFLLHGEELQDAEIQLVANSSKEPYPTELQREYVLKSRQVTDRQRRMATSVTAIGLIIVAALAVYGFVQAGIARNAQATAEVNAAEAQTAEANAEIEANQRATAQVIAEENQKLAEERANIALARQLAIQAQTTFSISENQDTQTVALLLATESMKLLPSSDTWQIIHSSKISREIFNRTLDDAVTSVAYSPDGNYVAWTSGFGVVVSETSTGKEIANLVTYNPVQSISFSPSGNYIIASSEGNSVQLWNVVTGAELMDSFQGDDLDLISAIAFSSDEKYTAFGGCKFDSDYNCTPGPAIILETATRKEITRVTHDDEVTSIDFSPDGKYVISGSKDTSVRLWETNSGKELLDLKNDFPVAFVAFSPDGGKYIITSNESNLKLWETTSGKEVVHIEDIFGTYEVMFSQDGKYVLYGNPLYGTKVLETATGKELHQLDTAIGNISSVAISPDGKYLAAPGLDNTVRVWEISTGEEISSISQGNDFNSVNAAAFSPDGKFVISGGCDEFNNSDSDERCLQGGAVVWEVITGRQIARMTYDDAVTSVAFSPDGKHVISGSKDRTVRIWEVTTGSEVSSIDTDANASLGFSLDGKYMVTNTGVDRNFISVWELASGKEIARMNHGDLIESFAISPDGRLVASGGWDHIVRIWEVMTSKEIMSILQNDLIFSINFGQDGKHLIFQDALYSARLWDLTSRKEIVKLDGIEVLPSAGYNPTVTYFVLSGDGKYFAAKTLDHIGVWEIETGNKVAELPFRRDLLSMAFSPNGKYIVSGGCDNFEAYPSDHCLQGNVTIWEVSTGKEFLRINQSEDIFFVAFSPDGKYVASGGCEQGDEFTCFKGAVYLWEAATGKEILHIPQDGLTLSVGFSRDGKYIVSYGHRCGQSADVCSEIESHVWEVGTGTEIINKTVTTFALFSPDGKYLISDTEDGNIHAFLWQPQDMISNACKRVSRNLTYGEWKQYIGTILPYQAVCTNLPIPESSLKEIALEALSNIEDPDRVPTALEKVTDVLESDETATNPSAQAEQIITNVIEEQLATMADTSFRRGTIIRYINIDSQIAILENANAVGLGIDPELLNTVCWEGSLWGYAEIVLTYCEQAVSLVTNDPEIRDSRGLARALTGDFSGAIADFEFAVQGFREYGQDELAIQREAWIRALKSGQNPFDEQTLETLRN